jgi:predicted nucleic acid-binding protein
MAFEKFVPPQAAGTRPRATIRPSGLISFDAASVAAFGLDSAKFAVLFFDKTRKIIGVKITRTDKEEGTLPMSRRRRSVSLKSPQFFHQYGLTVEESQRFEVSRDPDDGMLLISVRDVQRRRGRRPKKV